MPARRVRHTSTCGSRIVPWQAVRSSLRCPAERPHTEPRELPRRRPAEPERMPRPPGRRVQIPRFPGENHQRNPIVEVDSDLNPGWSQLSSGRSDLPDLQPSLRNEHPVDKVLELRLPWCAPGQRGETKLSTL